MNPLVTKVLVALGAAGLATLSATLLKGTAAEPFVFGLAGTLIGWVLPEVGKAKVAEAPKSELKDEP